MPWLLLLHQIPPTPPYFRAKVLRRLAQIGALPVKNSAYLLPETEDTREDFEWICREITTEGGTAWLFRAEALEGLSVPQLEESFRRLRDADYLDLLSAAPKMDDTKLTQRFEELKKIDFFQHPSQAKVADLIAERKQRQQDGPVVSGPIGREWVTRQGVKVDRIGSAWLIQRFIDPQATFRFVNPDNYAHREPEQRFDMFQGEFTHEGDLCAFEVLIARHHLLAHYPALQPLAEMIHDLDLKDERYQHAETNGLSRVLDGLCASTADDAMRVDQGGKIFDAFYAGFSA